MFSCHVESTAKFGIYRSMDLRLRSYWFEGEIEKLCPRGSSEGRPAERTETGQVEEPGRSLEANRIPFYSRYFAENRRSESRAELQGRNERNAADAIENGGCSIHEASI